MIKNPMIKHFFLVNFTKNLILYIKEIDFSEKYYLSNFMKLMSQIVFNILDINFKVCFWHSKGRFVGRFRDLVSFRRKFQFWVACFGVEIRIWFDPLKFSSLLDYGVYNTYYFFLKPRFKKSLLLFGIRTEKCLLEHFGC